MRKFFQLNNTAFLKKFLSLTRKVTLENMKLF